MIRSTGTIRALGVLPTAAVRSSGGIAGVAG